MYEQKTRGGAGDIFVLRFVAAAGNAHDFDSFLHGVAAFLRAWLMTRKPGMSRSIMLLPLFPLYRLFNNFLCDPFPLYLSSFLPSNLPVDVEVCVLPPPRYAVADHRYNCENNNPKNEKNDQRAANLRRHYWMAEIPAKSQKQDEDQEGELVWC